MKGVHKAFPHAPQRKLPFVNRFLHQMAVPKVVTVGTPATVCTDPVAYARVPAAAAVSWRSYLFLETAYHVLNKELLHRDFGNFKVTIP